jgi:hypothetical protein
MKNIAACFLLLGLFIGLFACQNAEPKAFDMYEESEMASLMRQMAHINEKLGERIANGEDLGEFPENFERILTASMTKSQEMDDFFREHAELFLSNQRDIYNNPEEANKYFNLAIDACIKCHETKCPGPVSRIEKLYLK